MMQKRNGEIDFLRFLFSLVIVIHHFENNYLFSHFRNGYVAVEFFFIVSGYLMASHVHRMQHRPQSWGEIANSTWSFVMKKVGSFFRYYVCVCVLSLVVRHIMIRHTSAESLLKALIASIPTFSLTFMGLNFHNMSLYIGNTWYLSAMLIGLVILYPILLRSFDFASKWLFPLAAMFLLAYLYHQYTVDTWNEWTGLCYTGVLRAVADLAVGVSLFPLVSLLVEKGKQLSKAGLMLVTVIKYACFALFTALAYGFFFDPKYVLHALLFCAIGIALSFSNVGYTIPDSKATRYLGKISLVIYIFHGFIRLVCKDLTGKAAVSAAEGLALAALSVVLSVLLMYVTDFLTRHIKSLAKRIFLAP